VCQAMAPELGVGRFSPEHATPAQAYAHSMQDRLPAPDVQAIREALRAHGLLELAALRRILGLLLQAQPLTTGSTPR
jgi:hypothetical protein